MVIILFSVFDKILDVIHSKKQEEGFFQLEKFYNINERFLYIINPAYSSDNQFLADREKLKA